MVLSFTWVTSLSSQPTWKTTSANSPKYSAACKDIMSNSAYQNALSPNMKWNIWDTYSLTEQFAHHQKRLAPYLSFKFQPLFQRYNVSSD